MDSLGIEDFNYHDNSYVRAGFKYSAKSLIESSKDLVPFKLPLIGIDISAKPWGDLTIKNFISHSKRLSICNLEYPIILDDTGYICDGWHRVVVAALKGDEYIMAVRLKVMPENIGKDE